MIIINDNMYVYNQKGRGLFMGKVITFINENGGIGKTSLIFSTSWEISKKEKVLMIDLDGQKGNLTFFSGVKTDNDTLTMFEVLESGKNIKDAVLEIKENLCIIPANNSVTNITQKAKMTTMRKLMKEMKVYFDYIFIDVNPNPDWRHFLALTSSDFVVIPMRPDPKALEGSNGIIESILEAQEYNEELQVLGMVMNFFDSRTSLGKGVMMQMEERAKKLGGKVFKSIIRQSVTLSENVMAHKGVTEYDKSSNASKDIQAFVKEFKKEVKARG